MGCHFLLQRIFLTQGSNLVLLHCIQMLYHLSHQGSPNNICKITYIMLHHLQSALHTLSQLCEDYRPVEVLDLKMNSCRSQSLILYKSILKEPFYLTSCKVPLPLPRVTKCPIFPAWRYCPREVSRHKIYFLLGNGLL